MSSSHPTSCDTKILFWKKGPCSHAMFYLLNREFGYLKEAEEAAADPLCGGLMQTGQQCGMLWGVSLAVGAESFRRYHDRGKAIAVAITATQQMMDSFVKTATSVNCREVTGCDFTNTWGLVKYFLKGKPISCTNLAGRWAPEAIQSAKDGLSHQPTHGSHAPVSCASEVARKMGASEEEMMMVSGFAGGLGLSGNACGALSAAIWMNTLALSRKQSKKSTYPNPRATNTLHAFYRATDSEMLCHKISGQRFNSIDEHTEFIKNGGCDKLMDVLAQS